MEPVILRTDRLLLRQWRDEDREPYAALNADRVVMEHFPRTLTRFESDAHLDKMTRVLDEQGWGLWAVEVPGAASCIGFVGLNPPGFEAHFTPAVEVGWRMARDHWGHGYATEAARECLRFAFEDLRLDEVVSFTTPVNERSQAVMRRLGMRRDPADDFDHPSIPLGHPLRRHVLFRLRREEWEDQPYTVRR
jgi:RimJ/RimL family protein N-acetyltransferase